MKSVHVYDLLRTLCPSATSYLGVGVQEGRCLSAFLDGHPQASHLALCDTWGRVDGGTGRGSHQHIAEMLKARGYTGTTHFLNGPSADLVPTLPLSEPFDVTYVDGDHSFEGALRDLHNVWARTGTVMVVHDTLSLPGVVKAIAWFLSIEDIRREMRRIELFTDDLQQGTTVVWR